MDELLISCCDISKESHDIPCITIIKIVEDKRYIVNQFFDDKALTIYDILTGAKEI